MAVRRSIAAAINKCVIRKILVTQLIQHKQANLPHPKEMGRARTHTEKHTYTHANRANVQKNMSLRQAINGHTAS